MKRIDFDRTTRTETNDLPAAITKPKCRPGYTRPLNEDATRRARQRAATLARRITRKAA